MKTAASSHHGLPLVCPRLAPPLDSDFRPAVLAHRAFRQAAQRKPIPLRIALERADGGVSVFDTIIADPTQPEKRPATLPAFERLLKFLLWSRGGWKVSVSDADMAARLQRHYRETPTGQFDAALMGEKIYERSFTVVPCSRRRVSRSPRKHGTARPALEWLPHRLRPRAPATAKSPPSSMAKPSSARRRSGIRARTPTRSGTSTRSWTR